MSNRELNALDLNAVKLILVSDKAMKENGKYSYCLKNCLNITDNNISAKETNCFTNCEKTYDKFQVAWEKEFNH